MSSWWWGKKDKNHRVEWESQWNLRHSWRRIFCSAWCSRLFLNQKIHLWMDSQPCRWSCYTPCREPSTWLGLSCCDAGVSGEIPSPELLQASYTAMTTLPFAVQELPLLGVLLQSWGAGAESAHFIVCVLWYGAAPGSFLAAQRGAVVCVWWGGGLRPAGAQVSVVFSDNFAVRLLLCVTLPHGKRGSFRASLACGLSCFVGG